MKRRFSLALLLLVSSLAVSAAADENYAEKSVQLAEKLATIVDSDKADCDKMASDMTAFFDANAEVYEQIRQWGKTLSPEEKKAYLAKYRPRINAAVQKMMGGLTKCEKNERVKAAYAKFPR